MFPLGLRIRRNLIGESYWPVVTAYNVLARETLEQEPHWPVATDCRLSNTPDDWMEVRRFYVPMVRFLLGVLGSNTPTNKEDQPYPVITGKTAAASGANPAARAQPLSVLPGFILLTKSFFSKVLLTALIDCIAARKDPRLSSYQLY